MSAACASINKIAKKMPQGSTQSNAELWSKKTEFYRLRYLNTLFLAGKMTDLNLISPIFDF